MAMILAPQPDENIVISREVLNLLMERGDSDAMMLYISLLSKKGEVSPFFCGKELHWDRRRIEKAIRILVELNLVHASALELPATAEVRQGYTTKEVKAILERSPEFQKVFRRTESLLGRQLPAADAAALTELFDFYRMEPEVLQMVVFHCYDEALNHGEDKPSIKHIEKIGYEWARNGVLTKPEAELMLQKCGERDALVQEVRDCLQIADTVMTDSQEKYIHTWLDWGFTPETIEMAYDRTVLNKGRMNWPYCNAILEDWKKKKPFPPTDIETKDLKPEAPVKPSEEELAAAEMRRYVEELRRKD